MNRKWFALFAFLSATNAWSSGPLPPLDSLSVAQSDAGRTLQKALFIELGVARAYEQANNFIAATYEPKVASFLDNNLPISSRTLFGLMAVSYSLGVKKQLQRQFKSPLLNATQGITLGLDHASTNLQIPF